MVNVKVRANGSTAVVTLTLDNQDFNFFLSDPPFKEHGFFVGTIDNLSRKESSLKELRLQVWRSDDINAARVFDMTANFNAESLKESAIAVLGGKYPILRSLLQFI